MASAEFTPFEVGPFRCVRRLGFRLSGISYLGLHQEPRGERRYVVKRVDPVIVADTRISDALMLNIHRTRALSHPNIAATLQIINERGVFYLVSDFVQGVDLAALFQHMRYHGPLPPAVAVRIIHQVADALSYAYQQSPVIRHGALWPSNVLIDWSGQVVVRDFGTWVPELEALPWGADASKDGYTPEHIGRQALSDTTDVFSLGALLYQLLTAHGIFDGQVPTEVVARAQGGSLGAMEHVPPVFRSLLRRSLAVRPTNRPATPAVFARELLTNLPGASAPRVLRKLLLTLGQVGQGAAAPDGVASGSPESGPDGDDDPDEFTNNADPSMARTFARSEAEQTETGPVNEPTLVDPDELRPAGPLAGPDSETFRASIAPLSVEVVTSPEELPLFADGGGPKGGDEATTGVVAGRQRSESADVKTGVDRELLAFLDDAGHDQRFPEMDDEPADGDPTCVESPGDAELAAFRQAAALADTPLVLDPVGPRGGRLVAGRGLGAFERGQTNSLLPETTLLPDGTEEHDLETARDGGGAGAHPFFGDEGDDDDELETREGERRTLPPLDLGIPFAAGTGALQALESKTSDVQMTADSLEAGTAPARPSSIAPPSAGERHSRGLGGRGPGRQFGTGRPPAGAGLVPSAAGGDDAVLPLPPYGDERRPAWGGPEPMPGPVPARSGLAPEDPLAMLPSFDAGLLHEDEGSYQSTAGSLAPRIAVAPRGVTWAHVLLALSVVVFATAVGFAWRKVVRWRHAKRSAVATSTVRSWPDGGLRAPKADAPLRRVDLGASGREGLPRYDGGRRADAARVAPDLASRPDARVTRPDAAVPKAPDGRNVRPGPGEPKQPKAPRGMLVVESSPAAVVYVNGRRWGRTPLRQRIRGTKKLVVVLQRARYASHSERVVVSRRKGRHLKVTLQRARYPRFVGWKRALLRVRCHWRDRRRIFIDGTDSGFSCPKVNFFVKPGRYRVGLFDLRRAKLKEKKVRLRRRQKRSVYFRRSF